MKLVDREEYNKLFEEINMILNNKEESHNYLKYIGIRVDELWELTCKIIKDSTEEVKKNKLKEVCKLFSKILEKK